MRTCSRCGKSKDEADFNRISRGRSDAYCRSCRSAYFKSYRQKNKSRENDRVRSNKKRILGESTSMIDQMKTYPCSDCGLSFHGCAMDFDHTEDNKVSGISAMRRGLSPAAAILSEIDKCELVCACCHRIRTWNRLHPERAL